MTQERDDYMQAQDAHHDMIAMRERTPMRHAPHPDLLADEAHRLRAALIEIAYAPFGVKVFHLQDIARNALNEKR